MASHVREGQGLCPVQVTSSNREAEVQGVDHYVINSMLLESTSLNAVYVAVFFF